MSLFTCVNCNPLVINFSSQDRQSGSNNDFKSNPVDLGQSNYNSVALVQASIPRTFYNIPNNYNKFTLEENGSFIEIELPIGSYNKSNLLNTIQTYLNNFSPNGFTYTVSYSPTNLGDTFHYTFTVSENSGIQPSFIFTDSLFRQLGFNINESYSFVDNVLESSNCIDLSYINRCKIKTDMIQSNDGTLELILNYGSYQMLSFCYFQQNNYDLNTRAFNQNNKTSWNFSLLDEYNQLIDLNGIPFSFSVVFYERNNSHELLQNELKMKSLDRTFKLAEQKKIIEDEEENIKNKINNKTNDNKKVK